MTSDETPTEQGSVLKHTDEEVHDQLDYMEVKILAKERPSNMAMPEAADKERR